MEGDRMTIVNPNNGRDRYLIDENLTVKDLVKEEICPVCGFHVEDQRHVTKCESSKENLDARER